MSSKLEDKEIIVFIDIGYSKTTITVAKFEKHSNDGEESIEADLILHESDRNLGGRDCDWLLLKHICE